jgi:hypothetical protein
LIPRSLIKTYKDNNCTAYFRDVKNQTNTTICKTSWDQINQYWQGLNWYDLFRKVYPQTAQTSAIDDVGREKTVIIDGQEKTYKSGFTFQEYTSWLNHMPMYAAQQPVLGTFLSDYINREDVRRALNIPSYVQGWNMCDGFVSENYHLQLEGSLWIYKIFLQYNYKMLHFSGDTDGAVPTYGTRKWIETLNLDVLQKWRSWNTDG